MSAKLPPDFMIVDKQNNGGEFLCVNAKFAKVRRVARFHSYTEALNAGWTRLDKKRWLCPSCKEVDPQ
jgi:hypothetical protein